MDWRRSWRSTADPTPECDRGPGRREVGGDRTCYAQVRAAWPTSRSEIPRGDQCGALSRTIRLRVADAALSFGHWRTVYGWFRELARRFLFQTIHDVALMLDRETAGREASPSAGVIDGQTIKGPARENKRLRRRQKGGRPQTPYCCGH